MEFLIVLLIIILICVGLWYLLYNYDKSNKGYISTIFLNHVEGIPNLGSHVKTLFYLYPDRITINDQQTISMNRIKGTEVVTNQEIKQIQKGTIPYAVAGGILLGPLGVIVGGIAGTGLKNIQRFVWYFIIQYIDKDGNDKNAIFYTDQVVEKKNLYDISKKINEFVGYTPQIQTDISSGKSYEI